MFQERKEGTSKKMKAGRKKGEGREAKARKREGKGEREGGGWIEGGINGLCGKKTGKPRA